MILHRNRASHVSLADIVGDDSLLVLSDDEWRHEHPQFTVVEQIRRIAGPACPTEPDEIEMPEGERLVDERASGSEDPHQIAEDRSVREVHAKDGVHRCVSNRQRPHVSGESKNSRRPLDRSANGRWYEVRDHDRPASACDWRRVTPRATGNVEDGGVLREGETARDDPGGGMATHLGILGISRFPMRAVVSWTGIRTHR